jgi:hypothetical protein
MKLEDGEYGRRAVITSGWRPEMSRYLLAHDVLELELNYAKGWLGNDLLFLKELSHLLAFKIIDHFGLPYVEPIHYLHELRALNVQTYCKTPIRFSEFPHLEDCGLEWRPKCESLFSCTTLKKLFVNCYKAKDVDSFSNLVNLEWLAILNAPVHNLRGLTPLKRLRYLRLANLRRLTSLAGIEELAALEELNIDTCRAIGSIGEVGSLSRLRKLHVSNANEIESLKPLEKLSGLEWVTFVESTNIRDGDLSPLLRQKNLSRVSFQNRRHYSHRREDFGAAYYGAELMKQMEKMGVKRLSNRELMKVLKPRGFWQRLFSR